MARGTGTTYPAGTASRPVNNSTGGRGGMPGQTGVALQGGTNRGAPYGSQQTAGRAVMDRISKATRPIQAPNPASDPRLRGMVDPYQIEALNTANRAAADIAGYGNEMMQTADANLMQGFNAPAPVTAQTVSAPTVTANTAAGSAGIDRAATLLADANASRQGQEVVANTALDWAQGNMPSVGQAMMGEAGVRAEEQFGRVGSETNQAYGTAANQAALAYANALASQQQATQQAGITASRGVRDAASDAVLRQAALTSSARGGNIGMALRSGLQGAAMQSADANRQGARLVSDANRQAADIGAAGQRQAQYTQAQGNLATQGTQERALMAASSAEQAANFQAAQIGSQEQQAALALAATQANALRGTDINAAQAATSLANTGVSVDQMVNAANTGNADRALTADTTNANLGLNADTFNAGMTLNTNQLNSQNWNAVGDRAAGNAQFGIGTQTQIGQQASQQLNQLAMQQIMSDETTRQMFFQADEATKDRILQQYAAELGVAIQARGQNIQMFGSAVGAGAAATAAAIPAIAASDRRAKKNIKAEKAPDFRKAGSYSYKYKDPDMLGAAPGKHKGPMADELPDEVITTGEDGILRVDIARLALQTASAIGDIQRRMDAA